MPRFYSTTEGDALKWIRAHMPKPTDNAPHFHKGQFRAFLDAIDRDISLFKGTTKGKALDQPLFRRPSPPSMPAIHELLREPEFRISHDKVHDRRKDVQKERQIDESQKHEHVWNRRPSSDYSSRGSTLGEDSPQASSIKDDDMDDAPELSLGYMRTEFSKWSYAKREGIDAVTGAVMGAPSDTHIALAQWNLRSKSSSAPSQNIFTESKEPGPSPEAPQNQQKRGARFLIFDNTDAGRRNAVTNALKTGILDPENPKDVEDLLQMLADFNRSPGVEDLEEGTEERAEGRGTVLEEIEDDGMHRDAVETGEDTDKTEVKKVVKSQRMKGKARKEAKKNATK